jgi:hypothetical protein
MNRIPFLEQTGIVPGTELIDDDIHPVNRCGNGLPAISRLKHFIYE